MITDQWCLKTQCSGKQGSGYHTHITRRDIVCNIYHSWRERQLPSVLRIELRKYRTRSKSGNNSAFHIPVPAWGHNQVRSSNLAAADTIKSCHDTYKTPKEAKRRSSYSSQQRVWAPAAPETLPYVLLLSTFCLAVHTPKPYRMWPCYGWDSQSPNSYRRRLHKSMWDLWRAKWQWDRFFSG